MFAMRLLFVAEALCFRSHLTAAKVNTKDYRVKMLDGPAKGEAHKYTFANVKPIVTSPFCSKLIKKVATGEADPAATGAGDQAATGAGEATPKVDELILAKLAAASAEVQEAVRRIAARLEGAHP